MIMSSSNLIFPFLNRLILRLTERLYVNLTRIIYRLGNCPPFGLFKHSFATIKDSASLSKDFVSESCSVVYSSFRKSPASDAQWVVGPYAGPHEICIEKDARAAFTLPRYLSPCWQTSSFESRKRPQSLVTDASHFTGTLAVSKGLNTWRVVKSVVCPEKIIGLCHNTLHFSHGMFLSFKLVAFSFLSDLAGSLIRSIRVGCGPKGCFGNDHFPDDSGKFSCHGSSGFSLDSGSFDKPFVLLAKTGIEFGHLESRFTESPSESRGSGLGDLTGIFLPVGDMTPFGQTGPACNGVSIFEPIEIPEFGHNDKPKHYTDAFWAGNDVESVFEVFVSFDNLSDFSQDGVSLSFNSLNSFTVLPEHLGFNGLEFIPMSGQPSMHRSSVNSFGSSGVYLIELPSRDRFDLCGFFGDSMPLPGEHSQMADFYRWDIGVRNEFAFHNLGDFCGRDFVGVSHSRPQLTEVKGIEQMDFIGDGLEHIPEPVVGSHRFDTDADRFFKRLDESDDFSGAMIRNGNFFKGLGCGIHSGIGSGCGMKIDS